MKSKNSTSETSERLKVARNLHDTVAQEVAALGYACDEAILLAPPGSARDSLVEIRTRLSLLGTNLRDEIALLREYDSPLGGMITRFLSELKAQSPIRIVSDISPSLTTTPELDLELYRTVRELITNIVQHSQGTQLKLEARLDGTQIEITIFDDGIENDSFYRQQIPALHFGQLGAIERMSAAGGSLSYVRDGQINRYRLGANW